MPHKDFDAEMEEMFPPITFMLGGASYTVTATPEAIDSVMELGERMKSAPERGGDEDSGSHALRLKAHAERVAALGGPVKASEAVRTQMGILTGTEPEAFLGLQYRVIMSVLDYIKGELFGEDEAEKKPEAAPDA